MLACELDLLLASTRADPEVVVWAGQASREDLLLRHCVVVVLTGVHHNLLGERREGFADGSRLDDLRPGPDHRQDAWPRGA